MRNFHRGYKNDSSSSFGRGDRRTDRDNRYRQQDSYKRPAEKVKRLIFAAVITLNALVALRDSIEAFLTEIRNRDETMRLINHREALMDRYIL